jgi:DinB superfamily
MYGADMSFLAEAIEKLAATPQCAADMVRELSEQQLSCKPSECFSLRENVLHLRDIDVEGYEKRVRLILSEHSPMLPDVDGGKLALERNYNAQPVEPALAELARSRAASVERLRACSEADLARTAEMQGVGKIDLRRLLELWMQHDADHLKDMAELRRAGEGKTNPKLEEHEAA